METTQEPEILFTCDNSGVGTLMLNRPDRLNAFGPSMLKAWAQTLDDAQADPKVRVIVVTGAGRAFSSGGDVKSMAERSAMSAVARKAYGAEHLHPIPLALQRIDKPVIAAVNGLARGAGMDMALMCDIRIAAVSATFAESYINIGLIAGGGGTYFLPRLVGTAKALELFWTGRTLNATEAEAIGLINQAVPDDEFPRVVSELAAAIAAQPTDAVKTFKRAVRQSMTMDLESHLDMVSSHLAVLRDSPEHLERVKAFTR